MKNGIRLYQLESTCSQSSKDGIVCIPAEGQIISKTLQVQIEADTDKKPINLRELEDCFNNCTENKSIDAFEEYFGLYPELDALLADKVLEYSVNFSLHDKVKFCLDLKEEAEKIFVKNWWL